MATFTLNWDNSLILAEVNAINQRASYRIKTVGGSFLTTGFTPSNNMATSVISATHLGTDNKIYEFKIEALCTLGGPIMNDNGVVEQIVFACVDLDSLSATGSSITATTDLSATDITKIKFSLRLQGDNSLVDTDTVVVSGVGVTSVTFAGLITNTAYYLEAEYYTTINGVEVISSSSDYLNDVCGGNVVGWKITTDVEILANLIWSWNKNASESVNLTGFINGSYSSVNWGDGTINSLLTHTYSAGGNYTVQIFDSTATIVEIRSSVLSPSVYKVTAFTALPSTVSTKFGLDTNAITSLPSLTPNTSLIAMSMAKNALTTFPNVSSNLLLEQMTLSNNLIVGSYDFSLNTALTDLILSHNNITGLTGFTSTIQMGDLEFSHNSVPVADINAALIALDNNGITGGIFISSNQTPLAAPTGLGLTAKTNLISKGWSVVTD